MTIEELLGHILAVLIVLTLLAGVCAGKYFSEK